MKGIDVIVEQAGSGYQVAVVHVLGQIDTTTSHELERRLQYLLRDHQFQIVIDLAKVNYISSAGWGIFISEIRGIRESGGDLKLAGMTPEVAEVFELLEFHNILESFRDVEEAVRKFEKPKGDAEPPSAGSGSEGEAAGEETAAGVTTGSEATAGTATAEPGGEVLSSPTAGVTPGAPRTSDAGISGTDELLIGGEAGREGTGGGLKSTAGAGESLPKDQETMILEIVRENPEYGCLKIRKELVERYYQKPINPLALFVELKRLNLETKEKRRKYSESAVAGTRK
ncbi:MAG: STAS domain-containing protein [Candidatus Eisenbacteria bacterium]